MSASLAVYLGRLESSPDDLVDSVGNIPDATQGFLSQLNEAGVLRYAAALIIAHGVQTAIFLVSWACIGTGALSGRFDPGWLAAWALALGSTVPLNAATTWLQGVVSIEFGRLLKQRLLLGAMAMDSDLARTQGTGALMSEALESEAIDSLGASGGVATALALVELLVTPVLFLWGAAGATEIGVFVAWAILCGVLFSRNLRIRADWTRQRVGLTNRLVENMTAHRTRSVQESPEHWHGVDDVMLEDYLAMSRQFDDGSARIEAALPRGYVIAAILGLAPAFLTSDATLPQMAISFGAILYAASSFERLCFGFSRGGAAWIAWCIVRPIFNAGARKGLGAAVADVSDIDRTSTVLQACEVGFIHPNRRDPILSGCNFSVKRGDQVLLEGGSGSGKSTFASIVAGLRPPSDGFILAGGLDRHTLGDAGWRRRIALAPQYHENHIVSGALIFNLLMSRGHLHTSDDIAEADAVCRELGLGGLLDSMPAGLYQIVGDTGWRLSQGERSRIFLARALLQRADVVVLDECLAALDPETLRQSLECVMRRAPTLIVIAHP